MVDLLGFCAVAGVSPLWGWLRRRKGVRWDHSSRHDGLESTRVGSSTAHTSAVLQDRDQLSGMALAVYAPIPTPERLHTVSLRDSNHPNPKGRSGASRVPHFKLTRLLQVLVALMLLVVLWAAYTSFYAVQPEERAVGGALSFRGRGSQRGPGDHCMTPT